MQLTGIDFFLWAAGFLAELALLGVLLARRRAGAFPFFTALIATNVLRTITLYGVLRLGDKHSYLIVYLSLGSLDLGLQLCVIYELAAHIFRPMGKWAPELRRSIAAVAVFSIVVATGLTWLTTPPALTLMRRLLIRGNFFSSVLTSELFVAMIVLAVTIGLPWKTHVARIAQGLGTYASIGILTEAGHSLLGMNHSASVAAMLSYVRISSYFVCLGYWIVMLWRDAPPTRRLPKESEMQLLSLQAKVEADVRKLKKWGRSDS